MRYARQSPALRAVLDTCVLRLATLPDLRNKAAVIWQLCKGRRIEVFASPETLGEYHRVLASHPQFLEEIVGLAKLCYPLFSATAIKHEPDNRFLEVALSAQADYLITVNTARGHFDRKRYQQTRVVTPGEFLNLPEVSLLLKQLAEE